MAKIPSKTVNVSPTMLDSWDYYRESDEQDFEEFLTVVFRERATTSAMERGNRFEDALYRAFDGEPFEWQVAPHVDMTLVRPVVRQMEVERTYVDGGMYLRMRGRIDGAHGVTIDDYKTTGHSIDLMKYADSFQWRCYLAAWPEMERFQYEVFQLNDKDVVTDHKTLTLARYPDLEQEVFDKVRGYAAFLRSLVDAGRAVIGDDGRPYRVRR